MALPRLGVTLPEETSPTSSPADPSSCFKNRSVPSLIGILSPINPHLFRVTPFSSCYLTMSPPRKSHVCFLLLEMVQPSMALTGLISSFISCPYRQSPASSLSVSLAPSPTGATKLSPPCPLTSSNFYQNYLTIVLLIETSKPSSPV